MVFYEKDKKKKRKPIRPVVGGAYKWPRTKIIDTPDEFIPKSSKKVSTTRSSVKKPSVSSIRKAVVTPVKPKKSSAQKTIAAKKKIFAQKRANKLSNQKKLAARKAALKRKRAKKD